MLRYLAPLMLLAGCATGSGEPDRVAAAEARWEHTMRKAEMLVDWCNKTGEDCRNEYELVDRELDRAERDIEAAYAAEDAAADRRVARSSALLGFGAQMLNPPRSSVSCITSNTSIPVTTCQ